VVDGWNGCVQNFEFINMAMRTQHVAGVAFDGVFGDNIALLGARGILSFHFTFFDLRIGVAGACTFHHCLDL
jgi:hypothetical protein